jgi:hypothetical protein
MDNSLTLLVFAETQFQGQHATAITSERVPSRAALVVGNGPGNWNKLQTRLCSEPCRRIWLLARHDAAIAANTAKRELVHK